MKYKALALDLDGTLTDSKKKLSDINKEAVWKAIDKGVNIILASGRPLFGITPIAEMLELQSRGGYILAYNGGNIVNCADGSLMRSCILPKECISDICRLARENNVYALTYADTKIAAESDTDEYVIKEAVCNSTTIKKVENLEKYVDYPVAKFLVVGEHEKLLPVQKALLDKHSGTINAFFSEDYFLEVVPFGVAKDASLEILLEKLGITPEEMIACGDGMNDIPMLKIAGLAAVMENAYPEVKRYADYIAPSNDDNGVSDVINKFILDMDSL
ncbi:MAG: Cof-type HAD-IIB family hydrolase [Lachnospira sp.]